MEGLEEKGQEKTTDEETDIQQYETNLEELYERVQNFKRKMREFEEKLRDLPQKVLERVTMETNVINLI